MSAPAAIERLESPFLSEEIRRPEVGTAAEALEQDSFESEGYAADDYSVEDYAPESETWPAALETGGVDQERVAEEADISEECEDESDREGQPAGEMFEFDRPQAVDFATAKNVMWEVIRILNRQNDANAADPDRAANRPDWYRRHTGLLKEWYAFIYGEPVNKKRVVPQGAALKGRLDAALVLTRPFVNVVKAKGGQEWASQLARLFYPQVAELEYLAARTVPPPAKSGRVPYVDFGPKPIPVSLEQFFSVVHNQPSEPLVIQRGHNFSLGPASPGAVFTIGKEQRLHLWSYHDAVLYLSDGVIYAQDRGAFSEDVLMGAFITAAQNAAGSAILAQLMVETALSFTPWGVVADGIFAFEALTKGDWKGAALQFLPGPAIGLASKSRVISKAARGTARGAAHITTIAAKVASRSIRYIGRGVYRAGNKLIRGFWLISDGAGASGKRTFQFFDENKKVLLDVPETTANRYIKCTNPCTPTTRGAAETLEGAVDDVADEIIQDIKWSKAYAPKGRVLVSRKLVKDVVAAYGTWGDWVVERILQTWQSAPNAHKLVNDTLAVAKDISKIKGAREIFDDLASSSFQTARGTLFELQYAAKHAKDIKELGIPVARGNWHGKGLDVLKHNGDAIELKHYNLASEFVTRDPSLTIARVVKQVRSRLPSPGYPDVKRVIVVFSSDSGMSAAFRRQLRRALDDMARAAKFDPQKVLIETWP
jgi:hypothetical protein